MLGAIVAAILYIALGIIWFCIAIVAWFLLHFSPLVTQLWNGVLVYLFSGLSLMVFVLPLVFRKRLPKVWMQPAAMLGLTVCVSLSCLGILIAAGQYASYFNRATWDRNEELRYYMVEDLERNYQLIGKTEQEIKQLLGEPDDLPEYSPYRTYAYYIGDGLIDPITYDITFENGVVVGSGKMCH